MKKILPILLLTTLIPGQATISAADNFQTGLKSVFHRDNPVKSKDILPLRDPFIPQIPIVIPEQPKPEPATVPQQRPEVRPHMPEIPPPSVPQLPSAPPRAEKPKLPQMKITGIVWNSKRPQAIINDQVFTVGDKIENFTVHKIKKDGIVLTNGDDEFMVPY